MFPSARPRKGLWLEFPWGCESACRALSTGWQTWAGGTSTEAVAAGAQRMKTSVEYSINGLIAWKSSDQLIVSFCSWQMSRMHDIHLLCQLSGSRKVSKNHHVCLRVHRKPALWLAMHLAWGVASCKKQQTLLFHSNYIFQKHEKARSILCLHRDSSLSALI